MTQARALVPRNLGFSTITECDQVLSAVGPNEHQCMTTVLEGHEDAAKEYLTCANAAYLAYVDCLESNVDCEHSIYDQCTADHDGALDSYPLLSVA